MAGAVVCAVVLGLAGLAVWRVLRRPKGGFCAMCSCTGCPNRGNGGGRRSCSPPAPR